jgi:hypothetical protein
VNPWTAFRSIQAARAITDLPPALFRQLDEAHLAPDIGIGNVGNIVSRQAVSLALPPGLDPQAAESINQRCQALDGIETIAPGSRAFP